MADRRAAAAGADAKRMGYLDDYLRRQIDKGVYAGVTTMVWRGDRMIHSNALGYADIARKIPIDGRTICRLYSMTKPIASVALMQLYERGLIELDAPAAEYIPEWKDLKVRDRESRALVSCARAMTVRDLLTHQSGLGSAAGARPAREGRPAQGPARTLAEAVARLAAAPLTFQPGAEFAYGVSSDILGHLVEVVAGERFDRYLQREIFEPLGMKDTGFFVPPEKASRLAALYQKTPAGVKLQDDPPTSALLKEPTYFSGSGGLLGTGEDYLRFGRMLLGKGAVDGVRILGRKTIELMAMNHLTGGKSIADATRMEFFKPFTGQGFGLGFGVMLNPAEAQLSGSPGEFYWTGAAGTLCFVDPAEDLLCLFMTQAMPPVPVPLDQVRNPYGWRELRAIVYAALD